MNAPFSEKELILLLSIIEVNLKLNPSISIAIWLFLA
jgi:hypothetical protein